ncbi:hypothetical protein AB2L27_17520 [Kineococcus sp. LSe6-4]|uniref:IclR-ED domain-containing protein n=1 Tax=Kineococcus halophytocola TaxID=3234027 RepID=A0ABV4H4R1_9ACTN
MSQSVLRALREEVGQTAHVAVLDDHGGRCRATCVDEPEPRDAPVRMASRVGSQAPPHRTDRTLADPARWPAEPADVADRGWTQEHAENQTSATADIARDRGFRPDPGVLP